MKNPVLYFMTSPEIIRLAVMMYIRYLLALRQVQDLLHPRCIDISYETVRVWWNRFGPIFSSDNARASFQMFQKRAILLNLDKFLLNPTLYSR